MAKPKSEKQFVSPMMTYGPQNNSAKTLENISKTQNFPETNSNDGSKGVLNFKTKLCRHFELGKCKLSGLCNFAHSQSELMFYQKNQKNDEKNTKNNENISNISKDSSVYKIDKLLYVLEKFYQEQHQMIEQMKSLSVSIKYGTLRDDETLSRMESNIVNLYKGAVQYTNEIGRTISIDNLQTKMSDCVFDHDVNRKLIEKNQKSNVIDFVDELDENQLEIVRSKLKFIIKHLDELPWKANSQQFYDLETAKNAFANGQLFKASKKLENILFDRTLDPQIEAVCRRIYDDTLKIRF